MARAVAAAGELDICVANAGISLMEPLLDGEPERWREIVAVNLIGVMVTFQAAARAIAEHGRGGRLLAVSSIAGIRGETHTAAYAASKAGVIGLVRALAVELAEYGITVNAVAPGQIDTRMHRRDLDALGRRIGRPAAELLREHLDRHVPARRTGLPEEVAALLTFLASDAAGFINGEIVRVDGGEAAGSSPPGWASSSLWQWRSAVWSPPRPHRPRSSSTAPRGTSAASSRGRSSPAAT
jgi:NAD(P)-dependent dehydrogenase (short-subunit alcohol dehydrogenase family)